MRPEWTWALAAAAAFTIGATCGEGYARLARPYYARVCSLIAQRHPWTVLDLKVTQDNREHSAVLRLTGEVRRHREDPRPGALVVSRIQVGEAVEAPVVFWTVVIVWPALSWRQRLLRVALGIPFFLGLEAATTGVQLIHSMPQASAILAGNDEPLTAWERWSRFLEAGGRFVLELTAALVTVATASYLPLRRC
jgi:hypothetical protein